MTRGSKPGLSAALARWRPQLPCCDSDKVQFNVKHPSMTYRCRLCRSRTETVMHGSELGAYVWVLATYVPSVGIRGMSIMKLLRDLGITHKEGEALGASHSGNLA